MKFKQASLFDNYQNNKIISPPIRYTGSKFRAAKFILPFLSKINYDEYREPFLGCGAIFFRTHLSKISWLNDLDNDLITTFKVIANKRTRVRLIKRVKNIVPSKSLFDEIKYKKYTKQEDVAYRYFLINRMAYGGIMNKPNWGFHEYKSVQPKKWPDLIQNSGIKLENATKITSIDFEKVISAKKTGKIVMMFIDPPYFNADQKRAYSNSFTLKDHERLLKILKKTTYNFCLTYDNCPEIKKKYSWAKIHEVEWMYHTANSNKTSRKIGKELIITNY